MPEPVGPFRQSLAVKHGSAVGGRVYLTFDDGPDATWTPRILDALAERDAHATFFMIGQQVLARKSIARRVLAEGHEIGNHSWSHRHPWLVDAKTAQQEVRDGSAAIADAVGHAPAFYRPPHGRLNSATAAAAKDHSQLVILWSLTAVDWGYLGRAAGIHRRLSKITAGDIVLMHDGVRTANHPEQLLLVLPQLLVNFYQRQLTPAPLPRLHAL